MKKTGIIAFTLCLCLLCGGALAAQERIFDRAELFSSGEKAAIAQQIADFQQETGMDFVIVTSDESHGDTSQQTIADEFYERGGFGLDEENSGILYYIDMYDRYHYLSTTGAMIDYMTDERISEAIDSIGQALTTGQYADAAESMIQLILKDVKAGIPEGQYRYDVVTGQRLTARHKVLTTNEILLCAILGLVGCVAIVVTVQSRYKLKGSTYQYDYSANSDVRMTDRQDNYLRTTVTRTRKPDPPKDGGGFGGGSGGSGVHTSSSGTSHGGGGGHF